MPNVPNLYAPWTHDEMLITEPAQQHSPVARPKSLPTGKEMKVEWTANCGPSGGKRRQDPTGSTYCAAGVRLGRSFL
jgi:nitrate reductase beta subunit